MPTKVEVNIADTREKLVKIIFAMQRQAKKRDQLKELLEEDFTANAEAYARGIETPSGLLIRRSRGYDLLARPVATVDTEA